MFATHFSRLSELAAVYPNCKLWHFGVNASTQSERLDYTWKLRPGQQQAVHYGLILANSVGIPEQVNAGCASLLVRMLAWTGPSELHNVFWCHSGIVRMSRENLNSCMLVVCWACLSSRSVMHTCTIRVVCCLSPFVTPTIHHAAMPACNSQPVAITVAC